MKKISFVNGSPKGNNSFSFKLLNELGNIIKDEKNFVNVNFKGQYEDIVYENLIDSDAIIISFPLYYYSLPGILIDFMQQFYEYVEKKSKNKKVIKIYTIVNCGFPEPIINEEAIRIVECFSNMAGFNFRFAVSIGGGGFINATKDIFILRKDFSNIKKALEHIKRDIYEYNNGKISKNILVKPFLNKSFVLFISGKSWYPQSRKNGLKDEDLLRKPYLLDIAK